MKVLPDLILSWPKEVGGRSGFWVLFALGLAALEVLGRFSSNDLEDGLAAMGLAFLLSALLFRNGRRSRGLLLAARNRFRRKAQKIAESWCDLEADLRGVPELPRGLPENQWKPTLFVSLSVPVLYLFCWFVPVDLRSGVADFFYVGYLALLLGLWGLMLSCGVICTLFSLTLLREVGKQAPPNKKFGGGWALAFPLGVITFCMAGFVFFPRLAPLVSFSAWAVTIILLLAPGGPKLDFAWKSDRPGESRRVTDWSGILALHSSMMVAIPVLVSLLGAGTAVVRGWESSVFLAMPVTGFLGIALAWVGAATAAAWTTVVFRLVWPGRRHNPALDCPVSLLCVPAPSLLPATVKSSLESLPFDYRIDGEKRQSGEVEIKLVPSAEDFRFQQDWPLKVTLADLAHPELQARIERRSDIVRRRLFFRSLEKLWKSVPAAQLESGEGVLLAPHQWFSPGLTRDEGREEVGDDKLTWRSQTLGEDYRKAMPISARHLFYGVMKALEIDMIYVERGIKYRHLRRALRIVFDVHDMHGGKAALQERDLAGIPGMKAIIHVFDFEEPFRSKTYPEPHYDGVGRARVLHLFRDRGEDESLVEDPVEQFGRPVPLLFG